MIDEVLTDLLAVIHPRSLYKTYQCQIIEANPKQIALSELESDFPKKIPFYSNQLATNLRGCPYVILMAATLGIEADKLLHKYELINMATDYSRKTTMREQKPLKDSLQNLP